MPPYNSILLIGAGGALGVPVLKAFMSSHYQVSVLTRQESTSTFPHGVPVIKADYTDLASLTKAMANQDVVISMVGGHVAGDQQKFMDAALAAGVKRFMPSEFGPNPRNAEFAELNPAVLPAKAAVVNFLRSKESQMSWTSLVTGAFFDWALETGFMGLDLESKTATLIDDGTTAFTATTLAQIGRAVIAVLDRAGETENRYVFVSSFNVSQRDVLDVVEKVGGQEWTVKLVKSEDVIERGRKKIAACNFAGIIDLTTGGAMGKRGLGDNRAEGLWNDKLELPEEDIEQEVSKVLARQSSF